MLTKSDWNRLNELRRKNRTTEEELEYIKLCQLQNQGVTVYETPSSN